MLTSLHAAWHQPSSGSYHVCPVATSDQLSCVRRQESIRTAFLLCQGGEFAFVLLSLAAQLKVLPEELNKLLIIVVVLSMALTPTLAELGLYVANKAIDTGGDQGVSEHEMGLDLGRHCCAAQMRCHGTCGVTACLKPDLRAEDHHGSLEGRRPLHWLHCACAMCQ